ncbi:MAG: hypothetical protein V7K53_32885 [Nostoc sp.]|uniref:hypothetical protein n=1 Tax=Nostoc sp. TaxID=1180 RepID=UPI002FFB6856
MSIPDEDESISIDNYYLSKATYEWALISAGFKEILWHHPIVDFLHKSGKREGGRAKGSVLSPSPLTFTLFPSLAKSTFARGLVSPEGIQKFGSEFWQDYIDYPDTIGITCLK